MEKIEIILDNYSQEEKNAALVAALKSSNSTLVELVLKLKPDILAGGAELFKYAIRKCDFELLGTLLSKPEISDNKELLNEGVCIAVSLTRTEWQDVLARLIEGGGSADVAVQELLEQNHPSIDVIIGLLKLGAKAHFWPMHLDKHQLIAESLFKRGFGQSIEFSRVALELFCLTICENSKQGVVKKLIKDRPELIPTLTEIAVKGGHIATVRTLHQENAITSINDKLFEKAITEKHYFTVKYLAENGIRKLKHIDVLNAAAFGTVNMMHLLIEQMVTQGNVLTSEEYSEIIRIACIHERIDCVKMLLSAGHQCDFDANIKSAAVNGDIEMVDLLMKYATKLNKTTFAEAINAVVRNAHPQLVAKMFFLSDKYRKKFH